MNEKNTLTLEEEIEITTKILNFSYPLALWYKQNDPKNMHKVIAAARLFQEIIDSRLSQKCPILRNGII